MNFPEGTILACIALNSCHFYCLTRKSSFCSLESQRDYAENNGNHHSSYIEHGDTQNSRLKTANICLIFFLHKYFIPIYDKKGSAEVAGAHLPKKDMCSETDPQSWRVTNTCRFPFEWLLLNVNWQRVKGKISKLQKIDTLRRKTLKVNVHCLIIVCKPPLIYCLLLLLKNEWSM